VFSYDLIELARQSPREKFVMLCPHMLLVGAGILTEQRPRFRTEIPFVVDFGDRTRPSFQPRNTSIGGQMMGNTQMVFAVRKVQSSSANIISVGRVENNDIVVADDTVSSFHAFFEKTGEGNHLQLSDAGSTNGTWVGDTQLAKGTAPTPVRSGDTIRFGNVSLRLLDAGTFWDFQVHDAKR
jgi:hypothetical protein